MPPRPYTLLIVALWAVTTGWLVYSDLWPRFQPGEPPLFTIDLADEASANVQKTFWTLFKDGVEVGSLETGVKYHEEDDTFEIPALLKVRLFSPKSKDPDVTIDSMYRVSREGQLRELAAHGQMADIVSLHLDGAIHDMEFTQHFHLVGPGGFELKPVLKPVPVSQRGSVFNPFQPVNKVRGLRLGQRWRLPMVDPFFDIVKAAVANAVPGLELPGLPVLQAEVLPALHVLPPLELKPAEKGLPLTPRRSGVVCQVIQYTSDEITARTWVRESDGVVLRQEASQHGDTWILDRD
jgi:hypothetical protein